LTGTTSGSVLVWKNKVIEKTMKNEHDGSVDCIRVVDYTGIQNESSDLNQVRVLTGGKDMKVKVWQGNQMFSSNSKPLFVIDMSHKEKGLFWGGSICPRPRALDIDMSGENLLIGTFGCEIFSIPLTSAD
jgi:hypothetical protein